MALTNFAFGTAPTICSFDGAAFEDDQIRNSPDAVARGGGGMIIDIELRHFEFAFVFAGDFFDDRRDGFTRAAPRRPEIDQHRHR